MKNIIFVEDGSVDIEDLEYKSYVISYMSKTINCKQKQRNNKVMNEFRNRK